MAESKSDQFANNIKARSEKIAKFDPLSVNRLAGDSECALPVKFPLSGGKMRLAFALPQWLTGAAGNELLKPAPENILRTWPVSRKVNRVGNDNDPKLIEPLQ